MQNGAIRDEMTLILIECVFFLKIKINRTRKRTKTGPDTFAAMLKGGPLECTEDVGALKHKVRGFFARAEPFCGSVIDGIYTTLIIGIEIPIARCAGGAAFGEKERFLREVFMNGIKMIVIVIDTEHVNKVCNLVVLRLVGNGGGDEA